MGAVLTFLLITTNKNRIKCEISLNVGQTDAQHVVFLKYKKDNVSSKALLLSV